MMPTLKPVFHTGALEAKLRMIASSMQTESIPQVGKTYARELPLLYAQGLGGDGKTLPDYNLSYAKRMGKSVSPKTLSNNANRLYEFEMDGDILTPKEQDIAGTSSRTVAYGQQTGASGRWPYSNVMFGANEPLQDKVAKELAEFLTERIGV